MKSAFEQVSDGAVEFRLITNALPVGVAYITNDLRYRFCNETYERWVGKSQAEILGETVPNIVSEAYFKVIWPYIERVLAGEPVNYEVERPCSDRVRHVTIDLVPHREGGGPVQGFVLLVADTTKDYLIRAELQAAKEAADAANEAKSAFIANMSHEIRTPLGAVLGFSELLATSALSLTDRVNFGAAIKRNGELLSGIISDILDLSKIEAGKLEPDLQMTSVTEVFDGVISLLTLQAKEKGLKLDIYADGPIPSVIRTDKQKLRQILLNIIGNAIKFTPRGSVTVRTSVICSGRSGSTLQFEVTDTGPGIAEQTVSRLFEPFFQVDASTKRQYGGTGLGLVLSRKLAQVLGGDVTLTRTSLGKGCTFTIAIDLGDILHGPFAPYQPGTTPAPAVAATEKARLDGLRVLLVEDSTDNQVLYGRILRSAGAVIEIAENGRRALAMASRNRYDVLLMDLQMPVMDGYEATATLRRNGYRAPIIALTAHALNEERQRCLAVGFDDHLTKPIERTTLVARLARLDRRPGERSH